MESLPTITWSWMIKHIALNIKLSDGYNYHKATFYNKQLLIQNTLVYIGESFQKIKLQYKSVN